MILGFFAGLICCLLSYMFYQGSGDVAYVFAMGSNVTVMIVCLIDR